MKYLLLLLLISLAYCEDQYGYATKYIDMPLDHFSFTTNATFKLRYLVNDSYHNDEGPIFFYTGSQGDITVFLQNTGLLFDLAPKFQALIIFAEHRFYGETKPFVNMSYTLEELGYLSTQQALADFVYLINDLQKQYGKKSDALEKLPVVAFGGDYGGLLSAWLRIRYPYAVTGAIASSAPIREFKGLTPCGTSNKIVTDVVRSKGSEKCMETIKNSWKILRKKMSTDIGKSNISSVFRLCKPLKTDGDGNNLIDLLAVIYTIIVMVNYPYPTSFLSPLPGNPVRRICEKMDEVEYSDEDGLILSISKGWEVFNNYTGKTKCNDKMEILPRDVLIGSFFQTCTELIMQTCSTDEDMFENKSWDFKSFSDDCYQIFGIRPRNEEVPILEFGDKSLKTASNIIFSNGLLDPTASKGVLKNISSQVHAVLILDGAHQFDLRGENPLDSESVKKAREFHKKHISEWLDKYYFQNLPQYNYHLKKNLML